LLKHTVTRRYRLEKQAGWNPHIVRSRLNNTLQVIDMLNDEEKVKIREEEEIRMDVRKNAVYSGRCHRWHWAKMLGFVLVLVLILGVFHHHNYSYCYQPLTQNPAGQSSTR